MSDYLKINELTQEIIKIIDEKKPKSIKQLTKLLEKTIELKENEIEEIILKLQDEGTIRFENRPLDSLGLKTYLKTNKAIWYWITLLIGAITATAIFTISDSAYPWIYARNFLGIVFVFFLPGYAFTKALFPTNILAKNSIADLEVITRVALSIGSSIALLSIIGLVLYYSPLGLNLIIVVGSLLACTLVLATIAVIRNAK